MRYLIKIIMVLVVGLTFAQLIFLAIMKFSADRTRVSVEALLRNDLAMREPYRIAQSLEDFESLGMIKCTFLKNTSNQVSILDTRFRYSERECDPPVWRLQGQLVVGEALGINGEIFQYTFVSDPGPVFSVALWMTRVGLMLFLTGVFRLQQRSHRLREEQIRFQAERLSVVQTFATQVAHDIRSPLAALRVLSNENLNVAERQELVSAVIQRLTKMSESLLESYKSLKSTGKSVNLTSIAMVKENYRLGELLRENVSLFQTEHLKKISSGITLIIQDEIESHLKVDPDIFARMLLIILNNALESISRTGQIKIVTSTNENSVAIEVSDTGKGIPEEILGKVGVRGFTYGKESGNGLGLSYVKHQMERLGGALQIASKAGIGTTVTLTFPT